MEENQIKMYRIRELPENEEDTVKAKLRELIKIQEELKKAKETATQSWLDSKPFIDELEKLQAELATAKNRTSMSNVIISELKSKLEAINPDITFKLEEELEAAKNANEISDDLDRTRQELETINLQIDEERKTRAKLKQVLRTKRQTLRALRLTLRAIRVESEALGASLAEAKKQISVSETENDTVELSTEEYYVLTQKAKDETAFAEWRVSVAIEQKLAAEASKNLALSRLQDLCSDSRSRRRGTPQEHIAEQARENESAGIAGLRARGEETARSNRRGPQQKRRSKRPRNQRPMSMESSKNIFRRNNKPKIYVKPQFQPRNVFAWDSFTLNVMEEYDIDETYNHTGRDLGVNLDHL